MGLDFTPAKYEDLLKAISKSDYPVIRIKDFFKLEKKPDNYIILRHDVDLNANHQLYFSEFDHTVMSRINNSGHEVGYHYETMAKGRGDLKKALNIFLRESNHFLKYNKRITICPHGGYTLPGANGYTFSGMLRLFLKFISGEDIFSKWKSADLWNHYQINKLKSLVIADAHLSFDFKDTLYLSDTGRSWDNKFKSVDLVNSNIILDSPIQTTDDIIDLITSKKFNKIYILVHFEQWKSNFADWQKWYFSQQIRRNTKHFFLNCFYNMDLLFSISSKQFENKFHF